jgi:septum formation protein
MTRNSVPIAGSPADVTALPRVPLTLASASPRRSQLLDQIGVPHVVRPADVDESPLPGESPRDYALRVAVDKAEKGWRMAGGVTPVLAADTAVALDDELFVKPVDRADCVRILGALSGRTHEVLTTVALRHAGGLATALQVSRVTFRALSVAECERYWATGEPVDKAGAYAIQGLGAVFVARLEGSYSGVMGLPLAETAALLAGAGIGTWQAGAGAGRAGEAGVAPPAAAGRRS